MCLPHPNGKQIGQTASIPPAALRYTVLFGGKRVGIHGAWQTGGDTWHYHYEFDEHGRGPMLDETAVLNAKRLLVPVTSTGPSAFKPIEQAQEAASTARSAALAKELGRVPATPVAIQHATLFDSMTARVPPHTTVVVSGKHIQTVEVEGRVPIPDGAEVIDARGQTLLPGLWDMHVHLAGIEGVEHLAVGVTTARDLGNVVETAVAFRRSFDDDTATGPRMILAGWWTGAARFIPS